MAPELIPTASAELIEAEAWAEHQHAASPELRNRFGIIVRRIGDSVVLMATRADIPAINRVLALGVSEPATRGLLKAILAAYRDAGVGRFVIQWSSEALPREAPDWFLASGFRTANRLAKLSRATDPDMPIPSGLSVALIGPDEAAQYGSTVTAGHDDPPELAAGHAATIGRPAWRHYLVFDGPRPIGGAAMFIRGDVAWCGFASTLSDDRGRGAHAALLAQRVRDAAGLGCKWAVCEAMEETADRPSPSLRNLRRAGFEVLYYRTLFIFGG